MGDSLLTTANPVALESRRRESERIALMHFCIEAIRTTANQELRERRVEDFAVVCVDILPLFQADQQAAFANSDPLSIASYVPHPAAVFVASDEAYAELIQQHPGQAHELMRTIPGMLKVIVTDDYGMTVCFIEPEPYTATRH
jgi:hypothetical protein